MFARNRLVLGAISLDLFAVLLGGATAMLPVYARDILHVGPEGLGHLRAAPALGATLTALFFSVRPLKHDVGVKMLGAVGVFGAATLVFGFSSSLPLSLACLAVLGAADMFSVYVRQSLIQLHTPDADARPGRRGLDAAISASNELGESRSRLPRRADRPGGRGRRRRRRRDCGHPAVGRAVPGIRASRSFPTSPRADAIPAASNAPCNGPRRFAQRTQQRRSEA